SFKAFQKKGIIIIINAIKTIMVMSFEDFEYFEGSFYPPLYIFFNQKIKVIIFQYVNFLNKQPILHKTRKYNL
ncbi:MULTISPECIES: hypothetical protein, partial [unclassified Bartonella]|uniref:hypothetical protein n=1 Tax=unclassified Bartonella TaxID=2645622 RepID=UPI0035CF0DDA